MEIKNKLKASGFKFKIVKQDRYFWNTDKSNSSAKKYMHLKNISTETFVCYFLE